MPSALCALRLESAMEDYPMAVITAPGKVEFVKRILPPVGSKTFLLRVRPAASAAETFILQRETPPRSLPMHRPRNLREIIQVGHAVTKYRLETESPSTGDYLSNLSLLPSGGVPSM